MSSKAMNRVDGAVKLFVAACGLTAGVCFMLLGWWVSLPFIVGGAYLLPAGLGQLLFGLSAD